MFANGLTVEHFRRGYVRNAESLEKMLAKAEAISPRKYRGYTVSQLRNRVTEYRRLATLDDAALEAHLSRVLWQEFADSR